MIIIIVVVKQLVFFRMDSEFNLTKDMIKWLLPASNWSIPVAIRFEWERFQHPAIPVKKDNMSRKKAAI